MGNAVSHFTTQADQAEGCTPQNDHLAPTSISKRTGIAPAINQQGDEVILPAETGVMMAVVAEGQDNTETQDARHTTAEQVAYPATQPSSRHSTTPSILIIEDSTELAEIIEATLQRLDMVTTHETHGNKAFSRYQEAKPDVVLLDIGLPDMIGWKLLENIREATAEVAMPKIIVITAYGDPANRLIGKLQNVHEYLVKPFTSDEVERVVLSALSSAGR